MTRPDVTLA